MLHCTGNGACWMSLVNCHTNLMRLGLHLSHVNISADMLCFWTLPCTMLVWKKATATYKTKKKKKMKSTKCLLCIFPSSFTLAFCLAFSPLLPLIDQWQNVGDVCFIKCLTAFLFLLAKQGIWKGQSCHPTSLAVLLPVSPPTEKKAYSCLNVKTVSKKKKTRQLLNRDAHPS